MSDQTLYKAVRFNEGLSTAEWHEKHCAAARRMREVEAEWAAKVEALANMPAAAISGTGEVIGVVLPRDLRALIPEAGARALDDAKAQAYDEGTRAVCPDPERCWCVGRTHSPHRPVDPNPYRADQPEPT